MWNDISVCKALVVTAPHTMPELRTELAQIAPDCQLLDKGKSSIALVTDLATTYRIVLWSRVASRVMLKIHEGSAAHEEALRKTVQEVDWSQHFSEHGTFKIAVTSSAAVISNSRYALYCVKDAIVDQFRDQFGSRPSIDTETPDVSIQLHLHKKSAVLYIDLAGQGLHRRGYRPEAVKAPLRETLAAALLLRAGWPKIAAAGGMLLDPMCGSGTLVIEAAMIAAHMAPGLVRQQRGINFGFHGWSMHHPDIWEKLLEEARQKVQPLPEGQIFANDILNNAVRLTRKNCDRAGVFDSVTYFNEDLATLKMPELKEGQQGLMIANPPYGDRLNKDHEGDVPALYRHIRTWLRQNMVGWNAALLASDDGLLALVEPNPSTAEEFLNGALEVKLWCFHILSNDARHDAMEGKDFANRVKKNLKSLRPWAKKNNVTCYRIYDADLPDYAVAIDLYEEHIHLQEYAPPKSIDPQKAASRLQWILQWLPELTDIPRSRIFLKQRKKQRGKEQYGKYEEASQEIEVQEGGHYFLVNLADYIDTGLFLEHRKVRAWIEDNVRGKRFLNLFCYTGSATVYAIAGGAISTVSVDSSNTYLDWAKRNLANNDIRLGDNHQLLRADGLDFIRGVGLHGGRTLYGEGGGNDVWAKAQERSRGGPRTKRYGVGKTQSPTQLKFDLIYLDPPTYSNSKRSEHDFDLQRDHVEMLDRLGRFLTPKGTILFSTHHRKFQLDTDALAQKQIICTECSDDTRPFDFSRNTKLHRSWLISRRLQLPRKKQRPEGAQASDHNTPVGKLEKRSGED